MQPEVFNWTHVLLEAGFVLVPALAGFYLGFRKILWLMGEYRLHNHPEKQGALQAENISYPRGTNAK